MENYRYLTEIENLSDIKNYGNSRYGNSEDKADTLDVENAMKSVSKNIKAKAKAEYLISKETGNEKMEKKAVKTFNTVNDMEKKADKASESSLFINEEEESYIGYDIDLEKVKRDQLLRERRKKKKKESAKFYNSKTEPKMEDILTELSVVNENFNGKEKLYPIFILTTFNKGFIANSIRTFTGDYYSHAAISLKPDLNECYTFNINKNGFAIESLNTFKKLPDPALSVFTVFLKESQYELLEDKLEYYFNNDSETSYKFINLFRILLNKLNDSNENMNSMVCSQFVTALLVYCTGYNIAGKDTVIVRPQEIYNNISVNKKCYLLFKGKIEDYNINKINKILDNVMKHAQPLNENFNFFNNGFKHSEWFK